LTSVELIQELVGLLFLSFAGAIRNSLPMLYEAQRGRKPQRKRAAPGSVRSSAVGFATMADAADFDSIRNLDKEKPVVAVGRG
jgi:hypothetical protein